VSFIDDDLHGAAKGDVPVGAVCVGEVDDDRAGEVPEEAVRPMEAGS
jgi:hypothetical protein